MMNKDDEQGYIYRLEDHLFLEIMSVGNRWAESMGQTGGCLDGALAAAVIDAYVNRPVFPNCDHRIFNKIEVMLKKGASASKAFVALLDNYSGSDKTRVAKALASRHVVNGIDIPNYSPQKLDDGHFRVLDLLLSNGADINAVSRNGQTLLHLMLPLRYQKISANLDISEIRVDKRAYRQLFDTFNLFLKKGARIDIPNSFGWTVFDRLVDLDRSVIYLQLPMNLHVLQSQLSLDLNKGLPYFLRVTVSENNTPQSKYANSITRDLFVSCPDGLEYANCPMIDLVGKGVVDLSDEQLTFAEYFEKSYPGNPVITIGQRDQAMDWKDYLCDEKTAISRFDNHITTHGPSDVESYLDEQNNTLLHKACEMGYVDLACFFVTRCPDCNLDARNRFALTPLMVLLQNHPEKAADFVKLAAEKGSLLTVHTPRGQTLLNGLIKSYSEINDDSAPGTKEGIEATFKVMLEYGARGPVFDWKLYADQVVNDSCIACYEYGIDKTRPLFDLIKQQYTDDILWEQLSFYLRSHNSLVLDDMHRLSIAAAIVKEIGLKEVNTDAYKNLIEKLRNFESPLLGKEEVEKLKEKWSLYMQEDSYDKYSFAVEEINPKFVKIVSKFPKIIPCIEKYPHPPPLYKTILFHPADQELRDHLLSCFAQVIQGSVKLLKEQYSPEFESLGRRMGINQDYLKRHPLLIGIDAHLIYDQNHLSELLYSRQPKGGVISFGGFTSEDVILDPEEPDWRISFKAALERLKAKIETSVLETKQFFSDEQIAIFSGHFQENEEDVEITISPGPFKIISFDIANDEAKYISGNYTGECKKTFSGSAEEVIEQLEEQKSLFKVVSTEDWPYLDKIKKHYLKFLNSVPFIALNEGQWIDALEFKKDVERYAPDLLPFVSQVEELDCGIYAIQYSKVDINKGTLNVQLTSNETPPRTIHLTNIPFWKLKEKLTCYSGWMRLVQGNNITLGDQAFILTETPYTELNIEDNLPNNFYLLLSKFDSCSFTKDSQMRGGTLNLVGKVAGNKPVEGGHGENGAKALKETQKKLKKLIHEFDALPDDAKPQSYLNSHALERFACRISIRG